MLRIICFMYGYIYLTTNLINNKKYIGQHRAAEFSETYKGSGVRISAAFKKYGKHNFSVIMLEAVENVTQLNDREKYWIDYYNAVQSDEFYNLQSGGQSSRTPTPHLTRRGVTNSTRGTTWIHRNSQYRRVSYEKLSEFLSLGFEIGGPSQGASTRLKRSVSRKSLTVMTDGFKTIYAKPGEVDAYLSAGFRYGRIPSLKKGIASKWIYVTNGVVECRISLKELEEYERRGFRRGRKKFAHFNRTAPAHNRGKRLIRVEGKSMFR